MVVGEGVCEVMNNRSIHRGQVTRSDYLRGTAVRSVGVLMVAALAGCSTISSAYHSTTDTVGGWFGMEPSKKKVDESSDKVQPAALPPDVIIPATLPQELVGVGNHPPYIPGSRPAVVVNNTGAAVAPPTPVVQTLSPEAAACVAAAKGKATTKIPFAVSAVAFDAAGTATLQQIAADFKQHAGAKLQILGNASDKGADDQSESEARAQAVASALGAIGIPAAALCTAGLGDTKPLYAETSEQDKAANQRVDVSLSY